MLSQFWRLRTRGTTTAERLELRGSRASCFRCSSVRLRSRARQYPARLSASAADQRMILMIDKELAAEVLASAAGPVEPQSVADRCSE